MTGLRTRHGVADSYIVRIYRRSDQPGYEVAGLVEPVETGERRAFAGRDELWAALTGSEAQRRPPPAPPLEDADR